MQSGETQAETLAAVKAIAANQYQTTLAGGKVLINANVNGESYSYSLPNQVNPLQVVAYARRAWLAIKSMNDAELLAYLEANDDRFTTADFSNLDVR